MNLSILIASPLTFETSNDNSKIHGRNLVSEFNSIRCVVFDQTSLGIIRMTNIVSVSTFRIKNIDVKHCSMKKEITFIISSSLLPRLPEFSGEPATHGLIPSTRDCSNQLLSFSSPINMKDHPSILKAS